MTWEEVQRDRQWARLRAAEARAPLAQIDEETLTADERELLCVAESALYRLTASLKVSHP